MKNSFVLLTGLMLALLLSCGGDDGSGPDPDASIRVAVASAGSAPSLASVDDVIWNTATATLMSVSTTITPSPAAPKAVATPPVEIKAVTYNDSLYLRVSWADVTHDVWRNRYHVTAAVQTPIPAVQFARDCCDDDGGSREDQLFVMFAGLSGGGYDTWNWRALTTGAGHLAEGMTWVGSQLTSDAGSGSGPALNNEPLITNPLHPTYMHRDSSEFVGHILYLTDAAPLDEGTAGWTVGQFVPGYRIDTTVYARPEGTRGSRWDIRACDKWDTTGQYTVVLCRPLNTGFSDDLNMATMDSVEAKMGFLNNQISLNIGGSSRGFTEHFWLIF